MLMTIIYVWLCFCSIIVITILSKIIFEAFKFFLENIKYFVFGFIGLSILVLSIIKGF